MIHPNASESTTVRSVFIIDPKNKVRLMITYPAPTGRNFEEIVRALEALQLTDSHGVATPVNWHHGDDVIVLPSITDPKEIEAKFPKGVRTLRPYLRMNAGSRRLNGGRTTGRHRSALAVPPGLQAGRGRARTRPITARKGARKSSARVSFTARSPSARVKTGSPVPTKARLKKMLVSSTEPVIELTSGARHQIPPAAAGRSGCRGTGRRERPCRRRVLSAAWRAGSRGQHPPQTRPRRRAERGRLLAGVW